MRGEGHRERGGGGEMGGEYGVGRDRYLYTRSYGDTMYVVCVGVREMH